MTAISLRTRRAVAVPPSVASFDAPRSTADRSLRATAEPSDRWLRVGSIELRSATRYLVVWATGLFAVLLLVLLIGYAALSVLGVIGSVSRALAIILDQPLPASGVLPVLQPQRVIPAAMLLAALLSGLWLAIATAAVLVHNATSALTGGLRVRVRADARRVRISRTSTPGRAR